MRSMLKLGLVNLGLIALWVGHCAPTYSNTVHPPAPVQPPPRFGGGADAISIVPWQCAYGTAGIGTAVYNNGKVLVSVDTAAGDAGVFLETKESINLPNPQKHHLPAGGTLTFNATVTSGNPSDLKTLGLSWNGNSDFDFSFFLPEANGSCSVSLKDQNSYILFAQLIVEAKAPITVTLSNFKYNGAALPIVTATVNTGECL